MTDINDPEATIVSTSSVLSEMKHYGTSVTFNSAILSDTPYDENAKCLSITPEVWLALGRPDTVTVTVEPDNTLQQHLDERDRLPLAQRLARMLAILVTVPIAAGIIGVAMFALIALMKILLHFVLIG